MRLYLKRCLPESTPAFRTAKLTFLERLELNRARYPDVMAPIGAVIDTINATDGFVVTGGEPGTICIYQEGESEAFPIVAGAFPIPPSAMPGVATSISSYGSPVQIFPENMTGLSEEASILSQDAALLSEHVTDEQQLQELQGQELQEPPPPPAHCAQYGRHLYISHDLPDSQQLHSELVDLVSGWARVTPPSGTHGSLIYFKYEPFTLTVMASSTAHAQVLLQAASDAGFRETGAINLAFINDDHNEYPHPMVTIRSAGLVFETLFGLQSMFGETFPLINQTALVAIASTAAARGAENLRRRSMFHEAFRTRLDAANAQTWGRTRRPSSGGPGGGSGSSGSPGTSSSSSRQWEPEEARRSRKRAQGLLRKLVLMQEREENPRLRAVLEDCKTNYLKMLDTHSASLAFRLVRDEYEQKSLQVEEEGKRELQAQAHARAQARPEGQLVNEEGESSGQAPVRLVDNVSGRASGRAESPCEDDYFIATHPVQG
jgi:tRNA(Phe) wybutosine-synthesizing methylase Tyw3